MSVLVHEEPTHLAQAVADALLDRLETIQSSGRTPRVALTGGRIAADVYRRLVPGAVDWTDVEFWWGDERFVPEGHADRNDQQARDAFLDRLGVPAHRIHAMPAHGCDLSMAAAADSYARDLPDEFDLVLLGVGPDGHVASLFPGVEPTDRLVVEVFNSPKPPAQRITLTFAQLNRAAAVWFIAAGADKAEAVAAAQQQGSDSDIPARGVRGKDETIWWLDETAASQF